MFNTVNLAIRGINLIHIEGACREISYNHICIQIKQDEMIIGLQAYNSEIIAININKFWLGIIWHDIRKTG